MPSKEVASATATGEHVAPPATTEIVPPPTQPSVATATASKASSNGVGTRAASRTTPRASDQRAAPAAPAANGHRPATKAKPQRTTGGCPVQRSQSAKSTDPKASSDFFGVLTAALSEPAVGASSDGRTDATDAANAHHHHGTNGGNSTGVTVEAVLASVHVDACPFMHGSVGVHPFPGYVHGRNPEICPNGCKPDARLGKSETPRQTLIREALEYQELFHHEKRSPPEIKEARVKEILASINATGTYSHTFEELEHGARVSWRNAPKCSNRKFAMELNILDKRDVTTPEGMNAACLEMLEKATAVGATETYMTVFPPAHPLRPEEGGPRVWNTQLLRFAAYRDEDLSVRGDPSELAFTEMCHRNFGWRPPNDGEGTRFDFLPLVLQASPSTAPELFEMPLQYAVKIPFTHPRHAWFADLKLCWYGIPAVSNMEMTLGGLLYTGIPFSGWYADVELTRNFGDEGRYNILPDIAAKLGYSTASNGTMWRDAAMTVLNEAIVHSYQMSGMGMVDHHTLMQGFWDWQRQERKTRGYMPGNWKWIIPPVSSATSPCYLGLNKMTEYTLKPALLYAPGFKSYARVWFGKNWNKQMPPLRPIVMNPWVMMWLGRFRRKRATHTARALLLYATVSGNTKTAAVKAAANLNREWSATVIDVAATNAAEIPWATYDVLIFMTSTYGSGGPPSSATRFLKWLGAQGEATRNTSPLEGRPVAVFGLGSTAYPRFCAAADALHGLLLAAGGDAIVRCGKGDALGDAEQALSDWLADVAGAVADRGIATDASRQLQKHLTQNAQDNTPFVRMYDAIHMSGLRRMAADASVAVAPVLSIEEQLTGAALKAHPGRHTKLVTLDLSELDLLYDPGDHIQIFPTSYRFAEELEALGLALDLKPTHLYKSGLDMPFDLELREVEMAGMDSVPYHGKKFPLPNTFRVILGEHCALLDLVDRDSLATLAQFAGNSDEKAELEALGGDNAKFRSWQNLEQIRWIELFKAFPSLTGRVPVEVYLQLVPLVHPRYYSIASSLDAVGRKVSMLVGRATWKLRSGGNRYGQCSDFLTTGCKPGTLVRFKIVRVATFRLPMNFRAPIIMVAAGTGLAPLRGFLQARLEARKKGVIGPAILLFGCRSRADQLCREEVEEAMKSGALTQALIAYSRAPTDRKQYVQDRVSEQGTWLANILSSPDSHVYVCGDSLMANSVAAAFAKLTGADNMARLTASGRFHEDVFGATNEKSIDKEAAAGRDSQRSLLSAAQRGDLQGVVEALKAGSSVEAQDEECNTVLHLAAAGGHLAVIEALVSLEKPPVINAVNSWGLTATGLAYVSGHPAVVAALQAAGGSGIAGFHSYYPLHLAVLQADLGKVQQVLQEGASAAAADWSGATALHLAAVTGNADAAKILLDMGAPPNAVDRYGHTPLAGALAFRHTTVAALIKAAGGRVAVEAPATVDFNPSGATSDLAKELGITPDIITTAQSMWSWLAQDTWPAEVRATLTAAGVKLFLHLFEISPQLGVLFPFKDATGAPLRKALEEHGLQVMTTVGVIVNRLGDMPGLMLYLDELAARHVKYGVKLVHYTILADALLATFEEAFHQTFGPQERKTWQRVFGLIVHAAKPVYARAATEQ